MYNECISSWLLPSSGDSESDNLLKDSTNLALETLRERLELTIYYGLFRECGIDAKQTN